MYRALIVCNSRFEDAGPLPELYGPKKDGMLLRDTLTDHDAGMFNKNDVQILSEEESPAVGRAIEDFFAAAEPDDTLLFYYSGHGRTRDQQLFLCARNTVVDRLRSTAISQSMLNDIVSGSFAQVKIIILDCCYSGLLKDGEIANVLAGTGRYIIAATSATERVPDSSLRGGPSPFTHILSEALISKAKDRDGDGNVDLEDIYDYLKNAPYGGPRPQRTFDGDGVVPIARRPLASKLEGAPETASLAGADGTVGAEDETTALLSYLDTQASGASFNPEQVRDFRDQMRDEILEFLPPDLSAREFLRRAGLFRNRNITYAGLLLFGKNPTAIMPTAMVQCVRFRGITKTDPIESSVELQDAVPALIVRARDFVADAARLGEAPTAQSAYALVTYKYPMIAVREIIANAIVHRDYEQQESSVQVQVYSDRIEIFSPGKLIGPSPVVEGPFPLSKLERPSQRRNFRLARALSWLKLVEGVGAGIPRAVADCRVLGTAEPMVEEIDEKLVKVTIFPVPQPQELGGRSEKRRTQDIGVADRITVALVPKAAEDLVHLQDRTGLSKTDITNRAISLYEFFDAQTQAGQDILVRDGKTGEMQLVRFL